jgi:hypothetical protein
MKKLEDLKEVELIINQEEDMVTAMGFVEFPATEVNLVYFNDEKSNYTFGVEDKEQGIIVSPALIAEKRIYRYDPRTNEEYTVYFSAETIGELSQSFLISNNFKNTTEQHEEQVNDIDLIYSWIVQNDQDQIMTKYGFKDIAIGSWIVAYKINNEDIKAKIKSGEIGGISIEAFLSEKYDKHSSPDEDKIQQIKDLLNGIEK